MFSLVLLLSCLSFEDLVSNDVKRVCFQNILTFLLRFHVEP